MKKYKLGIVPGSFDPITVGHVDIVCRAAKLCERVFLAVMINPDKKYTFDISERESIARAAVADIENVTVISSNGMLYELARALSADVIVKGVRNDTDRVYEENMAKFNADHYPSAVTVLLDADPAFESISSTYVRKLIEGGKALDGNVPKAAIDVIETIINK